MARAQAEHGSAPDDALPRAAGPSVPAAPTDQVYLWPENEEAWAHWCALQTQWRSGMAGATGLDYAAVVAYLREQGLRGDERRQVFDGIRAAETATLDVWARQRERDRQRAADEQALQALRRG